MLLSALSVLVVAQSSSEIPEGLMNNPVHAQQHYVQVPYIEFPRYRKIIVERTEKFIDALEQSVAFTVVMFTRFNNQFLCQILCKSDKCRK